MARDNRNAAEEFRRMLKWIALAAVLMVVGALAYLSAMGSLSLHTVIASVLGVFFSVVLGCGLFALAFFSDKSGHDDDVTEAGRGNHEK
jgi:protein-S-isoprenylcysteine O-methyltransferase Ste14